MPAVLTTAATVACALQGRTAGTSAGPATLVAGGQPVALATDVSAWQVAGCTATTPAGAPSPCATIGAPHTGTATKLVVGGTPVLLVTFSAVTVGSAVPHTAAASDAGQTVLEAM